MKLLQSFQRIALASLTAAAFFSGAANADTIVVTQINLSFQPADITINLGDTVRWIRTGGDHTVTEGQDGFVTGNEAFHSPLNAGTPVFEHTFDGAFVAANPRPGGIYLYECVPHFAFNMLGTVTVNSSSEPGASFCDCAGNNSPCNNPAGAGEGCANSTGSGAKLSATGSANALTDDITFLGSGLAPSKPTLLFYGTSQQNGGLGSPFGDGLRCAGGAIQRLNVVFSSPTGESTWGPGLNAGLWSAGDTRQFQIWYRDPQGSPCGSGFNFSNAWTVTY